MSIVGLYQRRDGCGAAGSGSERKRRREKVRTVSPKEKAGKTATRADLLDAIYESCRTLSRAQARDIFEMALEEISDALVRGETVKLRSFGLFAVRSKRERIGRNPRTGIEVPIKPRRVLTFKPSPVLIGSVNAGHATAETETVD
jgi:integration host factor subunit alpha